MSNPIKDIIFNLAIVLFFSNLIYRLLIAIKFKLNSWQIFTVDDHTVRLAIITDFIVLFFISLPILFLFKWCLALSFLIALILGHYTTNQDISSINVFPLLMPLSLFFINWRKNSKIAYIVVLLKIAPK